MKRSLLALPACLALVACGSHTTQPTAAEKQQETAAITAFDTVAQRCVPKKYGVPNVLWLRTKAHRRQFGECAVPERKRARFGTCSNKVLFGGAPSKRRIKLGEGNCLIQTER